jgi:CRISPR-associated protein Cas1
MATLYLTEQDSTLRKEQNRLVIERNGLKVASIHDFKVERVIVFGNPQITTQVMAFLLHQGIDLVFLSLHGRLKGRLTPLESKNSPLRVRQYQLAQDREFSFGIARSIVAGKIGNCVSQLSRYCRNHPDQQMPLDIGQLSGLVTKLGQIKNIDSLRGIEGHAAACYFKGFGQMLRHGLRFEKRTRRPPKDPVNALLSFGYTLLYNEAIAALAGVGFDPYIGFYHTIDYGRCSLALDLMEEFRPTIVDRLIINLVNLGIIAPGHFVAGENDGFFLDNEGRKRFFTEYEKIMTTEFKDRQTGEPINFRRALHEQALMLQRAVIQGDQYAIFRGWH